MTSAEGKGEAKPPGHRRRRGLAAQAAVLYLVMGVAWVLVTDLVLYGSSKDQATIARVETAKGWSFVAISALVVFFITRRLLIKLERSEATMRAVVDSIADGVLLVGRDTTIVDANPAAVRILGVRSRTTLIGLGPEEFLERFRVSRPDGHVLPPEELVAPRVLRGEAVSSFKAVFRCIGDEERIITATSAPVRAGPDERVELVVSVMHDQTEAAKLDRVRDDLFAAAAHTIKTPLAVIKGRAQLLGSHHRDRDVLAAVAAIDRQCIKADRLFQNLMVALRIRSNTLRLFPRILDLRPLVAKIAKDMRRTARDQDVARPAADGPLQVFLDADRTAQALRNLVDLALETSPDGATVRVVLESTSKLSRVGIRSPLVRFEEVHAEKILEDAWWVPESPLYAGLRLERHVSEHLVTAQGGRILRESPTSESRTIWVEFPRFEGRADVAS